MSKDNMEELQRYRAEAPFDPVENRHVGATWPDPDGPLVRFSDVAEREARFQARIKELEVEQADMLNRSQDAMYEAGVKAERERLEARLEAAEELAEKAKSALGCKQRPDCFCSEELEDALARFRSTGGTE